MGLAGYLAFPQGVQPNVMLMFPSSDMLIQVGRSQAATSRPPPQQYHDVLTISMMRRHQACCGLGTEFAPVTSNSRHAPLHCPPTQLQVARATLGLIQCISYPVAHHPARDAVYDLLLQLRGGRGVPGFRTVETLAYYGLTLAIALSVTDLGEMAGAGAGGGCCSSGNGGGAGLGLGLGAMV